MESLIMGFKVHLMVDCEVARLKQGAFRGVLRKDGWKEVAGEQLCWMTIFEDKATRNAALNVAKHDVDRALKKAEIPYLKAAVQFEDGDKEIFELYLKPGNPG